MPVLQPTNDSTWYVADGKLLISADGSITVDPETRRSDDGVCQGHHYAFETETAYNLHKASFQFRLTPHSDAGLILSSASPTDFWILHFPDCGQASRAQHFWAAVSRMRPDGTIQIHRMKQVHRVDSTSRDYHSADITIENGNMRVVIDELGVFEAEGSFTSGCAGVYLFNDAAVRGIHVAGEQSASAWNAAPARMNWFHPWPDTTHGTWQKPGQLVWQGNTGLLLNCHIQERPYQGATTVMILVSPDSGRTWPEAYTYAELGIPGSAGLLHQFQNGQVKLFVPEEDAVKVFLPGEPGQHWAEQKPVQLPALPDGMPKLHPFMLANTSSGTLFIAYGGHETTNSDVSISSWGAIHCQSFASVSTDDGVTWSDWVNIDGTQSVEGKPCVGNLDLTETSVSQARDGKVLSLTRPVYSPYMWESWSSDGGRTWSPCVRGPFPGYACSNLLRTASGYLVVGHRLPGLTVHTSPDGGLTWDPGVMIDSAIWAMGSMIEVAPDVVLYVYYDSFESLMRAQYLRVTTEGVVSLHRDEVEV